jgi:hypothetical protein
MRTTCGSVLLVVLLALVGCGGETIVTGTVKVDDKPLEEGNITLFPVDGKTATSGSAIKDGHYTVNGAPVGTMRVVVSKPKIVGYKKLYNTPDAKKYPVTAEALPERYSDSQKSELKIDVHSGTNQKNFELQSK